MQHAACSDGNGKSHTNIVVVPLSSTFSFAVTTTEHSSAARRSPLLSRNIAIKLTTRGSRASDSGASAALNPDDAESR
jgi:hypothetical protein